MMICAVCAVYRKSKYEGRNDKRRKSARKIGKKD
jgi:hypothetical protein